MGHGREREALRRPDVEPRQRPAATRASAPRRFASGSDGKRQSRGPSRDSVSRRSWHLRPVSDLLSCRFNQRQYRLTDRFRQIVPAVHDAGQVGVVLRFAGQGLGQVFRLCFRKFLAIIRLVAGGTRVRFPPPPLRIQGEPRGSPWIFSLVHVVAFQVTRGSNLRTSRSKPGKPEDDCPGEREDDSQYDGGAVKARVLRTAGKGETQYGSKAPAEHNRRPGNR